MIFGRFVPILKVYTYRQCDACRKALKFLRDREIAFREIPIRDTPPSRPELKALAARGSLRSLFNTSGADYRKLGLAGKLSKMSPEEAFALLAENGNLVKRPYVSGDGINLTGFDETEWKAAFG